MALNILANREKSARDEGSGGFNRAGLLKALIPFASAFALRALSNSPDREVIYDDPVRDDRNKRAQTLRRTEETGANIMTHEQQHDEEGQMGGFVPGLIIGGVIGGLVGAIAALWFAPQSGEETQALVREEATRLKQQADEKVGEVRSNLESAAQTAQVKADTGIPVTR